MMKLICLLLLVGFNFAIAATESLVAKCASNPNLGTIIQPGSAFYYIVKTDSGYSVISGVAHIEDNITERTQPLRGALPLLPVQYEHGHPSHWEQPGFSSDRGRGDIAVNLNNSEDFDIVVGSGRNPFTDQVYPTCAVWKH